MGRRENRDLTRLAGDRERLRPRASLAIAGAGAAFLAEHTDLDSGSIDLAIRFWSCLFDNDRAKRIPALFSGCWSD